MSIGIKVWSDFVCPFCMIAEQPLLEAVRESGLDVEIEWMPFELRPYPTPTLRPEDEYLQTVWPRSVYPLAARHGVEIRLPSVSPQPHTGLAWEGYQFAREHGRGHAYNDRVLRAFFQEDRDIGDIEVLAQLAGEIGLDADAFRQALAERRYRDAHQRALGQAREMGVTAVPTFVIEGQQFAGVQPREMLLRALRHAAGGSAESARPAG
ncbi:DsbA family oxidoreductase [Caldimonas tepidiphila]|uniref:DsbA family oxidoreductase n=1 Tax=Caldimonas tepidiphila TaxID=2315841 RepID=UPI000E5AA071|nr:DsbA family oxidoreductase [Caldimonas tepidiphila]